jgi:hypothetical protein
MRRTRRGRGDVQRFVPALEPLTQLFILEKRRKKPFPLLQRKMGDRIWMRKD